MTDPDMFHPIVQVCAVIGFVIVLFMCSTRMTKRYEDAIKEGIVKAVYGLFWIIFNAMAGVIQAFIFLWACAIVQKRYLVILSLIWFVFYAFVQVSYVLLAPFEERAALKAAMWRIERLEAQNKRAAIMAEIALYSQIHSSASCQDE